MKTLKYRLVDTGEQKELIISDKDAKLILATCSVIQSLVTEALKKPEN